MSLNFDTEVLDTNFELPKFINKYFDELSGFICDSLFLIKRDVKSKFKRSILKLAGIKDLNADKLEHTFLLATPSIIVHLINNIINGKLINASEMLSKKGLEKTVTSLFIEVLEQLNLGSSENVDLIMKSGYFKEDISYVTAYLMLDNEDILNRGGSKSLQKAFEILIRKLIESIGDVTIKKLPKARAKIMAAGVLVARALRHYYMENTANTMDQKLKKDIFTALKECH